MEAQPLENPLYANLEDRIEAIERLGAIWAKSGAFKCDRVEQGQAILSFCIASGITPLEYLATYHNLAGKPQKLALACLAQIRQKGAKHKWHTESDDPEKAILELTFEGSTTKVEFTIEDAKRQGLVKIDSNWVKAPSYMLRARCITTAIGMLAPEIVAGAEASPDEAPMTAPKALQLGLSEEPPKGQEDEEKILAKMGLAPVETTLPDGSKVNVAVPAKKEEPAKPAEPEPKAKAKSAKRKSISVPGETDEESKEQGIEPEPATIEPGEPEETPGQNVTPTIKEKELSPDIIDRMGHIFNGHFLQVALWMIKEGWIPAAQKDLQTEAHAAVHLQATLPQIGEEKALKILKNKESFIRAVTTAKL